MKKKLFAAALSLVMASILMVSSSFAWFTVSTAPEIADIDVTMEATKNLEIAKATTNLTTAPAEVTNDQHGDETKWGGKISSFTATLNFPATNSSGIKTVKYDDGGRTNGLVAATAPASRTDGVGYYTADIMQGTTPLLEDAKVAASFGVWLRSNTAGDVTAAITGSDTKWGIILADASGAPLANNKVTLTANTATAVQVIIYADGEQVKASDVASELKIENVKLTFSHAAITQNFAAQHGVTGP